MRFRDWWRQHVVDDEAALWAGGADTPPVPPVEAGGLISEIEAWLAHPSQQGPS